MEHSSVLVVVVGSVVVTGLVLVEDEVVSVLVVVLGGGGGEGNDVVDEEDDVVFSQSVLRGSTIKNRVSDHSPQALSLPALIFHVQVYNAVIKLLLLE